VRAGHDGTWVAHPGLVPVVKAVFDEYMKTPNQIRRPARSRSRINENDLLEVPLGCKSEGGFFRNVDVALQYIEAWLRGNGCVPIYNLMEDAATAEICRAQIWQWIHYNARLGNGKRVDRHMLSYAIWNVLNQRRQLLGTNLYASSKYERAAELLRSLSTGHFREFLTSEAYADLE
jgi:malate synthase